jgi:NADH:ubiquinone oxidoreductase subunit 6 (subunit J)
MMELILPITVLKTVLPILAILAGIFVITTQNAIISIFNLIVLYILVAFYLIYIGVAYIGISYVIIYVGAIAILFLFIIMMIDIEIIEKRSNNYLPLLFFLLSGFLYSFKKILYNIGIVKMKSLSFKEEENLVSQDVTTDLFEKIDICVGDYSRRSSPSITVNLISEYFIFLNLLYRKCIGSLESKLNQIENTNNDQDNNEHDDINVSFPYD